MNKCNYNSFSR